MINKTRYDQLHSVIFKDPSSGGVKPIEDSFPSRQTHLEGAISGFALD